MCKKLPKMLLRLCFGKQGESPCTSAMDRLRRRCPLSSMGSAKLRGCVRRNEGRLAEGASSKDLGAEYEEIQSPPEFYFLAKSTNWEKIPKVFESAASCEAAEI